MHFRSNFFFVFLFVQVACVLIGTTNSYGLEVAIKNMEETVHCDKILLRKKKIECLITGAVYLYSRDTVESISHRGERIYPYIGADELTVEDLRPENCSMITHALKGPMLLERNKHVYYLLANMLEKGICVQTDISHAKVYYKKAGNKGQQSYERLMDKYPGITGKKEVDADYLESLQQSANRKRKKREEWELRCQQECRIGGWIDDKYKYSMVCFKDCMDLMR